MHSDEQMERLIAALSTLWAEMGLRTGREWCQLWRGRIAVAGQFGLGMAAGG
jgi:5-aminolevulinate synthase